MIDNNINFVPVLNFNFSTSMVFRCTERKYANELIKGKIFFSKPKNWIKYEQLNGKGRGDQLEGTMFSAKGDDNSPFISGLKKRNDLEYFVKEDYIFFRKKKILDLWCACFYGLKNTSFKKTKDKNGVAHNYTIIDRSYFNSFSNNVTKRQYDNMPVEDQPTVVFIKNPKLFFKKIRSFFKKMGLKNSEYIISPVQYVDKYKVTISALNYPQELLLKDKYFQNQSEVRIIINTTNKQFWKYMNENNNTIDIGDISEIAEIYDYYFCDLILEKKDNTLLFNLPKPQVKSFDETGLIELLEDFSSLFRSIFYTYDLNEKAKGKKQLDELKKYLEKKYGLFLEYNLETGNLTILNTNKDKYEQINSWLKIDEKESKFNNLAKQLVDKKEFVKLKTFCDDNVDKINQNIISYYMGIYYKNEKQYEQAITKFNICLNGNYMKEQVLFQIAICYSKLGKHLKAIEFYKHIEDLIGYNHIIFLDMGLEYINMGLNTKAVEMFTKSLNLRLTPSGYYNRYVAYFRLRNFVAAKRDIEMALSLDMNNEQYKKECQRMNVMVG